MRVCLVAATVLLLLSACSSSSSSSDGFSVPSSDGQDVSAGDAGVAAGDGGLELGGDKLTPAEVATLVRGAGFPESAVGTMVCIAQHASKMYTGAVRHNADNGFDDMGLLQVSTIHLSESGCPAEAAPLDDPSINVACALSVWKRYGFTSWVAYREHKSECDAFPAP